MWLGVRVEVRGHFPGLGGTEFRSSGFSANTPNLLSHLARPEIFYCMFSNVDIKGGLVILFCTSTHIENNFLNLYTTQHTQTLTASGIFFSFGAGIKTEGLVHDSEGLYHQELSSTIFWEFYWNQIC